MRETTPVRTELINRIKDKAEEHVYDINDVIHRLRLRQTETGVSKDSPEYARTKVRKKTLQADKIAWNGLRRPLGTAKESRAVAPS